MQRLANRLQHHLRLRENIDVPEPQDPNPIGPDERVAAFIIGHSIDMLAAIELYRHAHFQADEVQDVGPEWALPSELEAVESSGTQMVSEMSFGVGWMRAKSAGEAVHGAKAESEMGRKYEIV